MNALASAQKTAFGDYELAFPFCQALVDDLKTEIPARYRKWDPDDRVWRILGAYAPAAIDLLLAHFPRAQVPDDQPRRLPSSPARSAPPPVPLLPIPFPVTPDADDQPEPGPLVASIRCPKCRQRHDQPVRVVVESSALVAKSERPPAELVTVCPHCSCLAVVSFWPAARVLQEAS